MACHSLSKRWLLIAALSTSTAVGCKNGVSIPVWNPFAKSGPSPSLVQQGENSYVQPNMPQPQATESSWSTPFKKLGDTLSSPFKTVEETTTEKDSISLANKVAEPKASLYVQLAKLHERSGKLSEAVAEYDKALDIDEKDLSALIGLAQLYDRIGRYEEALVFYGRAVKVSPDDATVHNDMGLCLARSDNMKDAAAAMRRAVSLDPKKVLYRNNLATVLVELDRTDEAYETLKAVHGDAVAHYNVGFLLNKKNRKPEALKHFELAAAADPSLKEAHQWVASLGGKSAPAADRTTPAAIATPAESPQPAPVTAQAPTVEKSAANDPASATTPKVEAAEPIVQAEASMPIAKTEDAPVKTEIAPVTVSDTAVAAKPTPKTEPAKAPLVNAELTNIPRPSIAKQVLPEPTVEIAAAPKAPASPVESTFSKTQPKSDATVEKREPSPKSTADADRYSKATVPAASLPRTPAAADAIPPLPEQISSIDVPELGNKQSSTQASTQASASTTSNRAPKFPASRY